MKEAEASYEEALANYLQTVLTAFKEVEDSLAQIALRNEQANAQNEALLSARHVTELAKARYEAGVVNYLELVDAERRVLQHMSAPPHNLKALRGECSFSKAPGGGWNETAN